MNNVERSLGQTIKQELIALELEKESIVEPAIFWEQKVLLETALSIVKTIDRQQNHFSRL